MLRTSSAPVFSLSRLRPSRARHPSGSSRRRYRVPPPWWPLPPQRNVGAKPCPKGLLTRAWLPAWAPILGWLAAWAKGHGHRGGEAQCPIKILRFRASRRTGSLRLARTLSKASFDLEGLVLAQHVVAGAGKLVRQRLGGHDVVGPGLLAFMEPLGLGAKAPGEVRRLDECPGKICVAVLDVAFAFFPAVAGVHAVDAASVGREVATSANRSIGPVSRRMTVASVWPIPGTLVSKPYCGRGLTRSCRRFVLTRARPRDCRRRASAGGFMMWRERFRRPADRRACRLGAGASIPRAAVRADARREDRRCERGRRRARLLGRCR